MADFVFNPRRAPRAPVRCRADVTGTDSSRWITETEDVGPRGCQIVAPHRRQLGEALLLLVTAEGLPRTLRVAGKVAWVSATEPWRLGIAFSQQDAAVASDWYDSLVARNPALAAYRGVPERISVDATVFLGPPPKLVMDFTNEEIQILRCVGSGVSVGEIRTRLKDIWERAQHALFSLIVRRHLVLARGASVLPAAWKQILSSMEATLAVEELERTAPRAAPPTPPPPVRTPPPTREVPAVYASVRAPPPPVRAPTPPPVYQAAHATRETRASTRAIDSGASWEGGTHEPHHDFEGAGVGWRSQPRPRGPDAERLLRQAALDAEAGRVDAAIATLRQALQLSPGDPEIAALLGRLAFRDRALPRK